MSFLKEVQEITEKHKSHLIEPVKLKIKADAKKGLNQSILTYDEYDCSLIRYLRDEGFSAIEERIQLTPPTLIVKW